MKKIILFIHLMLIVTFVTVCAETVESERQISNGAVTISGTLGNLKGYTTIVISEESMDELWDYKNDSIVYFEAKDCDGTYTFTPALSASGMYNVFIGKPDGTYEHKELVFVLKSENLNAISKINEITFDEDISTDDKITAIAEVLENNKKSFGLYNEIYNDINMTIPAKIILSYLKEPFNAEHLDENNNLISKFVLIEALNEGKINNIYAYESIFNLSSYEFYNLFMLDKSENITKRLSGKSFEKYDKFEAALQEAVILNKIEFADGYGEVQEVLEGYYDVIGLDAKYLTAKTYKMLEKSSFNKYSELVKYVVDSQKGTQSSGGGGGGGSSSGGGGGNKGVTSKVDSDKYSIDVIEQSQSQEEAKKDLEFFNDLGSVLWAKDAINYLYLNEVVYGKAEGVFSPLDNVTREEFVQMLIRAFDLKSIVTDDCDFIDVNREAWYYNAICVAKFCGIANGISTNEFGIGENISRQDIAVMVSNALETCNIEILPETEAHFKDSSNIAEYAKESVVKLAGGKIINGNDNGEFNPRTSATRAEATMILYNVMQKIK